MDIGVLQVIEKGASEAGGALLVGLVSGLAGALAASIVGVLSYIGVLRSAKAQLAAAKLAAETQQEAAALAGRAQIETIRIQADLEYRKLHAAHVTAERLRWLQDLRLRVAQMFRDLEEQVDLSRRPRPIDRAGCEAIQKRLDELSTRVLLEANVVWLMLNPKKAEQFELRKAISGAQSFVLSLGSEEGAASANVDDYRNCKQSAFDALTTIGVVTWHKVQGLK